MISTVLFVLFAIGVFLLVILLLLLLALAVLLFLPFRYRMDIETYPDSEESEKQVFKAEARLHWLFRFLNIDAKYDDGLKITGRLAFFRFFDTNLSEEDETKEEEVKPIFSEEEILKKEPIKTEAADTDFETIPREEKKQKLLDVFHIQDKMERVLDGLEEKWDGFLQKMQDMEDLPEKYKIKYYRLQNQMEDERNRNAVGILWKYGCKAIRHILPNKAYGTVLLGFDNPAGTGQAIAMLTVLTSSFCPDICVESDFERKIIEVKVHAEGRIRLWNILWYILMVAVKRDVWRLYKKYKRIRKEWKNGGQ